MRGWAPAQIRSLFQENVVIVEAEAMPEIDLLTANTKARSSTK
jgi:hypothetical protein